MFGLSQKEKNYKRYQEQVNFNNFKKRVWEDTHRHWRSTVVDKKLEEELTRMIKFRMDDDLVKSETSAVFDEIVATHHPDELVPMKYLPNSYEEAKKTCRLWLSVSDDAKLWIMMARRGKMPEVQVVSGLYVRDCGLDSHKEYFYGNEYKRYVLEWCSNELNRQGIECRFSTCGNYKCIWYVDPIRPIYKRVNNA